MPSLPKVHSQYKKKELKTCKDSESTRVALPKHPEHSKTSEMNRQLLDSGFESSFSPALIKPTENGKVDDISEMDCVSSTPVSQSEKAEPTSSSHKKNLMLDFNKVESRSRHDSAHYPPKTKQSWLLRLFESKLFDMSYAITYLFNSKEQGVQVYIGKLCNPK